MQDRQRQTAFTLTKRHLAFTQNEHDCYAHTFSREMWQYCVLDNNGHNKSTVHHLGRECLFVNLMRFPSVTFFCFATPHLSFARTSADQLLILIFCNCCTYIWGFVARSVNWSPPHIYSEEYRNWTRHFHRMNCIFPATTGFSCNRFLFLLQISFCNGNWLASDCQFSKWTINIFA